MRPAQAGRRAWPEWSWRSAADPDRSRNSLISLVGMPAARRSAFEARSSIVATRRAKIRSLEVHRLRFSLTTRIVPLDAMVELVPYAHRPRVGELVVAEVVKVG